MTPEDKAAVIRLWCIEFPVIEHKNSYFTSTMWVGTAYNKVLHSSGYDEKKVISVSYTKLKSYIWEQISRGMI